MNYSGVIIAVVTMAAIGIFHPIVIKAEYYFSKSIWPLFAVAGLGLLIGSMFIDNVLLSAAIAVVGASCLWGIRELFQQEKRVQKGQFPINEKRLAKKARKNEKSSQAE